MEKLLTATAYFTSADKIPIVRLNFPAEAAVLVHESDQNSESVALTGRSAHRSPTTSETTGVKREISLQSVAERSIISERRRIEAS